MRKTIIVTILIILAVLILVFGTTRNYVRAIEFNDDVHICYSTLQRAC